MGSPTKLNEQLIEQANEYLLYSVAKKRYPTIRALTDELGVTRRTFYRYVVICPQMAAVKNEILAIQDNFQEYFR